MFEITYREKQRWKIKRDKSYEDYYITKTIRTPTIIVKDEDGNVLFANNQEVNLQQYIDQSNEKHKLMFQKLAGGDEE